MRTPSTTAHSPSGNADREKAEAFLSEARFPLEIQLQTATSPSWIEAVLNDFDSFLIDHAACERKASATAVQFIVKYPDRTELIEPMSRLAREELLHFQQVLRLILKRDIQLKGDERDPYVNELLKQVRHGRAPHFLDRLLTFGIIEARGTERFGIVAQALQDPKLRDFYQKLTEAEARHHLLFTEIAQTYFSEDEVRARLHELLQIEAEIIESLPIRSAVH